MRMICLSFNKTIIITLSNRTVVIIMDVFDGPCFADVLLNICQHRGSIYLSILYTHLCYQIFGCCWLLVDDITIVVANCSRRAIRITT